MAMAGGCGGDDPATPQMTTSVDNDKQIRSLSESEMKQLCEDMAQTMFKMFTKERLCTLAGLSAKALGSDCLTMYDACIKDELGKLDNPAKDMKCTVNKAGWQTCTATVAELQGCLNQATVGMDSIFSNLTCSTDTKTGKGIKHMFDVSKCKALEAKCKDMFEVK